MGMYKYNTLVVGQVFLNSSLDILLQNFPIPKKEFPQEPVDHQ